MADFLQRPAKPAVGAAGAAWAADAAEAAPAARISGPAAGGMRPAAAGGAARAAGAGAPGAARSSDPAAAGCAMRGDPGGPRGNRRPRPARRNERRIRGALWAPALLLLLAAAGCGSAGCGSAPREGGGAAAPEPPAPPRALYLAYAIMPESPRLGEPLTIGARAGMGIERAALEIGGRRLGAAAFFAAACPDGGPSFKAAVLTVPTTASAGPAIVVLEDGSGPVAEIRFYAAAREFPSETIRLTPAMTGIQRDVSPQRIAESQHLWAVLGSVGDEAHFFCRFVRPVESTRRTSLFGARRVFVSADGGSSTSIHAGIDYGVPTGTPVFASGGGRIALARDRIVSGKSVIIEHLPGVFSVYYHLDSIGVAEGDMVMAGDVIGLSGATGFATGPHLHWELRVFGENTDPDAFVARPLLDKAAILAKLGY